MVFLDIQMPGASGFDVLERLDHVPLVLFHDRLRRYAVRAFDVNAFDYLLKPVKPERLAAALDKTRKALADRRTVSADRVRPTSDRVFVRDGERCWIVALGDIALFEGEGNYTRLYFDGNRPLIRSSLASLEARLDQDVFFRANRRHLSTYEWSRMSRVWAWTLMSSTSATDAVFLCLDVNRSGCERT